MINLMNSAEKKAQLRLRSVEVIMVPFVKPSGASTKRAVVIQNQNEKFSFSKHYNIDIRIYKLHFITYKLSYLYEIE